MKRKVSVSVYKERTIGSISKNLFGSFLEHIGRAIYTGIYEPDHPMADEDGFRTDVLQIVKDLGVPLVRYPGGNFVSGYRWQDGIGPRADRPKRLELAWKSIESNQVGIDEFALWAKKAGCEIMAAVNLGTAGPQEAADLVEYCNFKGGTYWSDLRKKNGGDEPYKIPIWCIGNEMDGDWQMGHLTAHEYGRKAHETIKMMKWTDPSIQVAVVGSSAEYMPTFPEWDRTILEHTYDEADYLSLHQYYKFVEGTDKVDDYLRSYVNLDSFINSVRITADYVKTLKRSKKTMMLSLDEWNIWHSHLPNPPYTEWQEAPPILENSYDVKDALLFAGMMMTMINHADRIKIGCLAQLINVIAPILTQPGGGTLKQTIFYPYLAACQYAKGTALEPDIRGDKVETVHGDTELIHSAVTYDEDKKDMTVFLLNPTSDTVETNLKLFEFAGLKQIEHLQYGTGDLDRKNTFENPNAAVMQRIEGEKECQQETELLLPAYSFHVIRYQETK